jgi:hypothetical protein
MKRILVFIIALGVILLACQKSQVKEDVEEKIVCESNKREIDKRVEILRDYFSKYNCPLLDNVEVFIEVADENGIDWRLLPAISMQESTCGKFQRFNNPFGYGYYRFDNFDDSIRFVGSAVAGNDPNERAYNSANRDSERILWIYNGGVNPEYPAEVMRIMDEIE